MKEGRKRDKGKGGIKRWKGTSEEEKKGKEGGQMEGKKRRRHT